MLKKIAVFTSTRADYGLLLPLLRRVSSDERFELRLLVGGSHLLPSHGRTVDRIRDDGFPIRKEFPFLPAEGGPGTEAASMGLLALQMGDYLAGEKPDILVFLGDRFELLPVASVALVMNIPMAHISGGDVTEGAMDNQVRHALTKMAHLHFPATEAAKANLLRMGEEEWRICVAGEPGLDEIPTMDPIPREQLFEELSLPAHCEVLLATFHPETLSGNITPAFLRETVDAILAGTEYHLLFTAANFDPGGEAINGFLRDLAGANPRIRFVDSLGQRRFYSLMNHAKLMIGNSSSGLTEAQSFGLPVVNVGRRQQGRLANPNVIHVPAQTGMILEAMQRAVTESFQAEFRNRPNIYGDGHAGDRMLLFLESISPGRLLVKRSTYGA